MRQPLAPSAQRRPKLAPALAAAMLAGPVLLAACGGSSGPSATPASTPHLSVMSAQGRSGSIVQLKGSAGSGCGKANPWAGFRFQRPGQSDSGPSVSMAPPLAADGTWSATFTIPSYLGSAGQGAWVSAGRYQFATTSCTGAKTSVASFKVLAGAALPAPTAFVAMAPTTDGKGYWLVQADGKVTAHGDAPAHGSLSASQVTKSAPVVAMARPTDNGGYWLVSSDGKVFAFGDAHVYGSVPAGGHVQVVSIAASPDGKGYWLLNADGHVYNFGDATTFPAANGATGPFVAIGTRPGGGYAFASADTSATYLQPGGTLLGGGPGTPLAASLVGMAVSPSGNGAWLAGSDGGIITYGDAAFDGSVPGENVVLASQITAIAARPDGQGYWLLSARGAIFAFGGAHSYPAAK